MAYTTEDSGDGVAGDTENEVGSSWVGDGFILPGKEFVLCPGRIGCIQ